MSGTLAPVRVDLETRTGRTLWRWRFVVVLAAVCAGALVGVRPVVGLAVAGLVFLTVVIMAKPDWATLVAVAVLYSNAAVVAHRVHGLPKSVGQAAALLVAIALVHHLGVRRQPLRLSAALPWFLAFLVVQLVGAVVASEPMIVLEKVQDFLTGGLFLYLAFHNVIRSYDVLKKVLWIVLVVGAVIGAIGLHQSSTGRFEDDYGGFAQISEQALLQHGGDDQAKDPRASGPIGEKNYFAQMMFVLVPLGLLLAIGAAGTVRRLLAAGLTLLIALGGALAVSRGGAVGLALGLLILAGMRYLPLRHLLVIVLAITAILSSTPRYTDRLASIASAPGAVVDGGNPDDADGATTGRLGANAAALRVFWSNPILGVGSGMFNSHYREQAMEAGVGRIHEGTRAAHNLFLHIAAEFGLVGFVALFGGVAVTLRELMRARRRVAGTDPELAAVLAGIFGAIVTYLTTGVFLSLAYQRYFWFLLALGAVASTVAFRDEGAENRPWMTARV